MRFVLIILSGLLASDLAAGQADILRLRPKTSDQVIVLPENTPNPFVLSPLAQAQPARPAVVQNTGGEAPIQEFALWASESLKAWSNRGEVIIQFGPNIHTIGEKIGTETFPPVPNVTLTEALFQGVTATHAIYRISGFRQVAVEAADAATPPTIENRTFNEVVQVPHPEFLAP